MAPSVHLLTCPPVHHAAGNVGGGRGAAQGLSGGGEQCGKAVAMVAMPRGAASGTAGIVGAGIVCWTGEKNNYLLI